MGFAEVGDPGVVGSGVGGGELVVIELGLPLDAEGGIEEGDVDALIVEKLYAVCAVGRAEGCGHPVFEGASSGYLGTAHPAVAEHELARGLAVDQH